MSEPAVTAIPVAVLPPRDQKAYDLGRSSRNAEVCRLLDVIRGLRAENADLKAERGRHLDAIRSLKEVAARHE